MNHKINLQNPENEPDLPSLLQLQRWVSVTLETFKPSAEVTIRFVSVKESQTLNYRYRQQNKPTNVLSFPSHVPEAITKTLPYEYLGDLIICPAVVVEESQQQNKTLSAHYTHLVVHGILHLLGYDHIKTEDANIMEPLEINILSKLGLRNPYEVVQ